MQNNEDDVLVFNYRVEGGDFANAGTASSEIKKTLWQLNIDPKKIKRVIVSLYEAEVNIVAHAYSGEIAVEIGSSLVSIVLKDKGPGIADIEKAMQEGFTTASEKVVSMGFGAGMGLPNMKKNSDYLDIQSKVGEGTVVTLKVSLI